MRFINNKLLFKIASNNDSYLGKHKFQGNVYHGKLEDFTPHTNIFEPLTQTTSIPPDTQHVSAIKPKLGNDFDKMINHIHSEGGNPYLVGGFVRDHLLGLSPKDRDIEVYNMDSPKLDNILKNYGKTNDVGASFGVKKFNHKNGDEYDFSFPRRDSKISEGHKGFHAEIDPNMTTKEASSRRDFTHGSMMMNPISGEIIDHHGGLNDLKNKTLRATSEKYKEDPLRVLRGMQFAARMGLDMDPNTAKMSNEMGNEYHTLSSDRIMGEWQKLAEKGITPSKGLKVLQDTNWTRFYPELKLSPEKMQHVDNIAKKLQSDNKFSPEDKNALFFATLTHDMPKEHVASFLQKIGMPGPIQKRVLALKNGIDSPNFKENYPDEKNVRNLSHHLAPENIDNFMNVVDSIHGPNESHRGYQTVANNLGVNQKAPAPFVNGNNLAELGIKQGPIMGKLLKEIYQKQLNGEIKSPEEAIEYAKQNSL